VGKWHDLTFDFLGGGVSFPFYSVQDCSLPLLLNEVHPGEQRGRKLIKIGHTTNCKVVVREKPYSLLKQC